MSEKDAKALYDGLLDSEVLGEDYAGIWEKDKTRFLGEYVLNEHVGEEEDDDEEY